MVVEVFYGDIHPAGLQWDEENVQDDSEVTGRGHGGEFPSATMWLAQSNARPLDWDSPRRIAEMPYPTRG
ncbi:hypothetical protein CCR94_21590 [Rhodoblastus sphagnicola]|uniref:Uncharacterized protein n=1 Tax=Rhodoblastus sphagnicola TaxID=333368 RepID=A0A2S6MWH7_9HYPH|nr:hypothetical protein CCR94_21590 [Rhodoblastus sphagnicola]